MNVPLFDRSGAKVKSIEVSDPRRMAQWVRIPVLHAEPLRWFKENEPIPLRREGELPPGISITYRVFELRKRHRGGYAYFEIEANSG